MLSRRVVLLSAVALAATVAGCSRPTATWTWDGIRIEVYLSEGTGALIPGYDGSFVIVEVEAGHHRILIRKAAITVDGVTKDTEAFTRVVIDARSAILTVTIDGAPLFP